MKFVSGLTLEKMMETYFEYLDQLRESGVTNMFGAAPYLMNAFPELDRRQSKDILLNWMETFSERHRVVS